MKALFIISLLLLAGCHTPKQRVLDVSRPLERATVSVVRAERHLDSAKAKITDAKGATAELERTATAEQKPHVLTLKTSLAETEAAHLALASELEIARVSNQETGLALDALTVKYERAEARAAKYARLKLWNAIGVALLAGYAAWCLIPSIAGPYKLYVVGGAAAAGGGITYLFL